MGAEATCERLDGTANEIGRGTPSTALLGHFQLSQGACTAGLLDASPTLLQCWQEPEKPPHKHLRRPDHMFTPP